MIRSVVLLLALVSAPDGAPRALTLEALVELANSQNLDLAAAGEKVAQADAQLRKAWAALLPVVTAAGAYVRSSDEAKLSFPDFRAPFQLVPDPAGSGGTILVPSNLIEATIQPFDQWGGVGKVTMPLLVMPAYSGIAAAEAGVEATKEGINNARAELLFGVAQAYYGTVAAERLVDLSGRQLEAAERQEKLATVRVEAGQQPKISALRAGVDRARAEQDVRRAENARAQAMLVLVQLCGIDGDFRVAEPPPLPSFETAEEGDLVGTALEKRHDLASARFALASASRGVDAAWWSFAPVVAASGELRLSNVGGFTGETATWLVQLAIEWTVFDAGRHPDLDLARSRLREAALAQGSTARKIVQEVKSARLELLSAQANLVKAQEQERLAEEHLAIVEGLARNGLATYLEATDAQTARFGAGVAAVTEGLNVQVAALKLLKATGRLFER